MYSECIPCKKRGVHCDGPDFAKMTPAEFLDWIRAYLAYEHMTHAEFAARCNLPLGTINRLLSGASSDFKHETCRAMVNGVFGASRPEKPCPDPDGSEQAQLSDRVHHLEQELLRTKELADRAAQRDADTIAHLKLMVRNHRIALSLFAGALVLVLLAIIVALVYDIMYPHIGWFK